MPDVEFVHLSADDADAIAARADLHTLAQRHDQPYDPELSPYILGMELSSPFPGADHEHWLAVADGALIGVVELELPTLDNHDNAAVSVLVHPAHRRLGYGRQLAAHAFSRARANGRSRVIGEICEGLVGAREPALAGVHFGHALGAQRALPEVRRRVDVTAVPRAAVRGLLATATAASPDYHLVPWTMAVPDEILDGVASLESRLVTDSPMGDLKWEPENYDAKRWRATESTLEARRCRTYGCATVHSAYGEVTGYTMCTIAHDVARYANQWTTIVHPDHRGHRLGLRLKASTQLRLLDDEPELRMIDTWNSPENAPMIAINEALGYRPLDSWSEWQIDLV